MTGRTRIALIGYGKIARDQHRPAIEASGAFDLVAIVDPAARAPDLPSFTSFTAMLAADLGVEAVALCQPPQHRYVAAREALGAGLAVLLEKPPCATVAEVLSLVDAARQGGRTLFAAWHSRFAPALEPARRWLADRRVQSVAIAWREDVRRWHPGQQWIWWPGGLGVFDAGINALSLVSSLLDSRLHVREGALFFPSNRATPIAASLALESEAGIGVQVELDWLGPQAAEWDIRLSTDGGEVHVGEGGGRLRIAGMEHPLPAQAEYPRVYGHFAGLIARGAVDVDTGPLQTVADAFLRCRRQSVPPFIDDARALAG